MIYVNTFLQKSRDNVVVFLFEILNIVVRVAVTYIDVRGGMLAIGDDVF